MAENGFLAGPLGFLKRGFLKSCLKTPPGLPRRLPSRGIPASQGAGYRIPRIDMGRGGFLRMQPLRQQTVRAWPGWRIVYLCLPSSSSWASGLAGICKGSLGGFRGSVGNLLRTCGGVFRLREVAFKIVDVADMAFWGYGCPGELGPRQRPQRPAGNPPPA